MSGHQKKLKAIEGILLDRDGNPILQPSSHQGIRSFLIRLSTGPWIAGFLILFFIFAGLTLASTLGAILIGAWIIRFVFNLLGIQGPREGPRNFL